MATTTGGGIPPPSDHEMFFEFRSYILKNKSPEARGVLKQPLDATFAALSDPAKIHIYHALRRINHYAKQVAQREERLGMLYELDDYGGGEGDEGEEEGEGEGDIFPAPDPPDEETFLKAHEAVIERTSAYVLSLEDLDRAWKLFCPPPASSSSSSEEEFETDETLGSRTVRKVIKADLKEGYENLAEAYSQYEKAPQNSFLQKLEDERWNKQIPTAVEYTARVTAAKTEWAERQLPCPIPAIDIGHPDAKWQQVGHDAGGMGQITFLASADTHGRIEDRLVIKDTEMSPHSWNNMARWYGEVTREAFDRKVPVEFWAHRQATLGGEGEGRGGHPNIIGLRSRKPMIDEERRVYRLFLEYAGMGDLEDLIGRYYDMGKPIPEAFIVYVFKALIEACLVMKNGRPEDATTTPSKAPTTAKKWEEIVHRDLKPANLFLSEPNSTCFPAYPEPKLGDFGLAFLTTASDAANPWIWTNSGTPGYSSPEVETFVDGTTRTPVDAFKILSPCNVWGMGVILKALLERRSISGHEQPGFVPTERFHYRLDDHRIRGYNEELRQMVQRCMAFYPDHRPKMEDLKIWIDEFIARDAWLSQALAGTQDPTQNRLILSPSRYQVGMALEPLVGLAAS